MRYFITFACYGARLHGAEAGSVDPRHNLLRAPLVEPDSMRVSFERNRMPTALLPGHGKPCRCARRPTRGMREPRLDSICGAFLITILKPSWVSSPTWPGYCIDKT